MPPSTLTKNQKFVAIRALNGGLDTRPTPLVIEANYTDRMNSPALRNVEMFPTGAIAKRLGKTKQGSSLAGSTWASQTSNTVNIAASPLPQSTKGAICQKIVAGSSKNIISMTVVIAASYTLGQTFNAVIRADSAGAPGAVLTNGTSNTITNPPSTFNTFLWATPCAVVSGTTYWFCIEETDTARSGGNVTIGGTGAGSSGRVKYTLDNYSTTPTSTANDIYYVINVDDSPINGIYDFRYSSAQTQKQIGCTGGAIYWNNAGTWTSLRSGLGSGQNNIYAFATLQNYMFSSDYGNNVQTVWNGTAAYMINQGYQAGFTLGQSASAGGPWSSAGIVKVMGVTTITSGGYRTTTDGAGNPSKNITLAGTTNKIDLTSVGTGATGATDFGFDASTANTIWFCTTPGGFTFYKIPAAYISGAGGTNPPTNATNFSILPMTDAQLTAGNSLVLEFSKEQGYFTSQVTTPTCKYLSVFQNMLAMAGDASNPSRVWFSQLGAPMIWSTRGGIEGTYVDCDTQDGEVITGIHQWNGVLYAFKEHGVWIIEYTGVASNPITSRKLAGNVGALSHWSIKDMGSKGLIFLSQRGPANCLGTFVNMIPSTAKILNKFDPNDSTRYNLSSMAYTTAGNYQTKSQVHWGVSSTSATTRDLTLVYDYENDAFWENDVSANYYTEVSDSSYFPYVWSGDYSAQVFQMDTGTNDNGSAISFYFDTPVISLGAQFYWKQLTQIFIAGTVQSSGSLYVDIYLENSGTVTQTLTYDMTNASFKAGQSLSCGLRARLFRLRLRNSDLDVPVQVDSIGFGYNVQGSQY